MEKTVTISRVLEKLRQVRDAAAIRMETLSATEEGREAAEAVRADLTCLIEELEEEGGDDV